MTYLQTINRLLIHKWLVAYYARRYFPWRISRWDALVIFLFHDSDKFLHLPSVKYRFETGKPTKFSERHIYGQKHHWQSWQSVMPNRYVSEMVADWLSASQLETGVALNAIDFAKGEIERMRQYKVAQDTIENCEFTSRRVWRLKDFGKWYAEKTKK